MFSSVKLRRGEKVLQTPSTKGGLKEKAKKKKGEGEVSGVREVGFWRSGIWG